MTWVWTLCRLHPPASASSSPTKPKNGARWSGWPTSRPSDPRDPGEIFRNVRSANAMPLVTQTGPCSQLPLAVILAPRARPRHNGFVVHAWLHRAGCRAVRTARSRRAIVPFTHLAREGRMTVTIGRRGLLAALGSAAAWPLAAGAQITGERVRRIGVLINLAADDPEGHARITAFGQGLQEAGWTNDEPALVSAVDGAGSAMLFSVAAAI